MFQQKHLVTLPPLPHCLDEYLYGFCRWVGCGFKCLLISTPKLKETIPILTTLYRKIFPKRCLNHQLVVQPRNSTSKYLNWRHIWIRRYIFQTIDARIRVQSPSLLISILDFQVLHWIYLSTLLPVTATNLKGLGRLTKVSPSWWWLASWLGSRSKVLTCLMEMRPY